MADQTPEKVDLDKTEPVAEVSDVDLDLHDDSKVKFVNGGKKDEAQVEIGVSDSASVDAFVGLNKEELMKYTDDPFWVKVRYVLFISFWVIWLAMLVAAIVIIAIAPKCPYRPPLEWYHKSTVYQVYPKSFLDGKGDNGVGDLKGISDKLDYFLSAQVGAIYINSIYKSGMKDGGYDVVDHKDIDPVFGTMAEFDDLLKKAHKKELKVIMDFIPNHTGKNCSWFQSSVKNESKYDDYYIWHSGGGQSTPPNNWLSRYGHRAWTWSPERGQWYYHTFLPDQPDLNLRNPEVQKEMADILRFWLNKGVDGMVVNAAEHLVEATSFEDEPASNEPGLVNESYETLKHLYTTFQNESFDLITKWQAIVDDVSTSSEKPRVLLTEAYGPIDEMVKFYNFNNSKGANLPLNFNLLSIDRDCKARCLHNLISSWMIEKPSDAWSTWVLGNHNSHRVADRKGERYVNVLNMLLMMLPGTPFTYYGEEIGMKDVQVPFAKTVDEFGKSFGEADYVNFTRDFERSPMQWTSGNFSGFTTFSSTWLPVASNYKENNVKGQGSTGAGFTPLEVYTEVAKLHSQPSVLFGKLHFAVVTENILCFLRKAEGFPGFLAFFNFGDMAEGALTLSGTADGLVPKKGLVVATSGNLANTDYKNGTTVDLSNVHLGPAQGIIFMLDN
ncbi:maltase A3 [Lingula anatina]|uniref:Maltase A3 n=1 Tax=Lingula anatina TaxID=7574 RepID=A0A1S3JK49_LINAN|nr:maltase A3 [Lingula anatina]|eukprot:XP_013410506.1 maltase A3 [Lingula anatina]